MTEPLDDYVSSLSRDVAVVDIEVEPLTLSDTKEGVQAMVGEEVEQALVDFVYRESGGIPFFIEEIIAPDIIPPCIIIATIAISIAPPPCISVI